jgi:hypothetical protein
MLISLAALMLAAAPAAEPPAATPPAVAGTNAGAEAFFEPVTKMEGPALQVVFGERATVHLGDDHLPVIDKTEKGKLAIAHPAGAVKDIYVKPKAGQIAVALDGSAEKKATYLKVWNGLDYPIIYKAGVLRMVGSKLAPQSVKVCAVPAGGTQYETWTGPPVVAVALGSFTKAADDKTCN